MPWVTDPVSRLFLLTISANMELAHGKMSVQINRTTHFATNSLTASTVRPRNIFMSGNKVRQCDIWCRTFSPYLSILFSRALEHSVGPPHILEMLQFTFEKLVYLDFLLKSTSILETYGGPNIFFVCKMCLKVIFFFKCLKKEKEIKMAVMIVPFGLRAAREVF